MLTTFVQTLTKPKLVKIANVLNMLSPSLVPITGNKDDLIDSISRIDPTRLEVDPIILMEILTQVKDTDTLPDVLTLSQRNEFKTLGINARFNLEGDQLLLWYLSTVPSKVKLSAALEAATNRNRQRQLKVAALSQQKEEETTSTSSTEDNKKCPELGHITRELSPLIELKVGERAPMTYRVRATTLRKLVDETSEIYYAADHLNKIGKQIKPTLAQQVSLDWLRQTLKKTQTDFDELHTLFRQHWEEGCRLVEGSVKHSSTCMATGSLTEEQLMKFFRESADRLVPVLHFNYRTIFGKGVYSKTNVSAILRETPTSVFRQKPRQSASKDS